MIANWFAGSVATWVLGMAFCWRFSVMLAVVFLVTGLGWVDIASFLGKEGSEKNAVLSFIGVAMGGTLLAINAVASHRRAKAMEWAAKAQAAGMTAQAAASQQTERGRQQERFKNAIEHLGHESAAVRLGIEEHASAMSEVPEAASHAAD